MNSPVEYIRVKINSFRRKYYLGFFIRGVALTLFFVLLYFLIISLAEHILWLGRTWRLVLLLSLIGGWVICFFIFLKKPLYWYFYRRGLSQEESAKIIGRFVPVVGDTLLNLVQLSHRQQGSALLKAGIQQKADALSHITFESAVDLSKSKHYLWMLVVPIGIIVGLLLFSPSVLIQSSKRIVRFNQTFSPLAPFSFHVKNTSLQVFKGEDFTLRVHLSGSTLPTTVYIRSGAKILKMESVSASDYIYTFKKVAEPIPFLFESSGIYSDSMLVQLMHRPELTQVRVELDFPRYLSRARKVLSNVGNLEVPEGTRVTWKIGVQHATAVKIGFPSSGKEFPMTSTPLQQFVGHATVLESEPYYISLKNDQTNNKDSIVYHIDVIKDQYPQLSVDRFSDSTLFRFLVLGGHVSDDHGVTALTLHYRKEGAEQQEHLKAIAIQKSNQQQSFLYTWLLEGLEPGDKINYFLEVQDNDAINGPKITRSSLYTFSKPGKEVIKNTVEQTQNQTERQLNQSLKKTKALNTMIERVRQQLKGKVSTEWSEKSLLEDILKQKDSLFSAMEQLQKQQEQLNQQRDSFLEQDAKILEKTQQIKKLIDDLFDEKTKSLFKELQQLLHQNADLEQLRQVLNELGRKETGIEQSLERVLALLNQLKFDLALAQTIQVLKDHIRRQKTLLSNTQEKINTFPTKRESHKTKNEIEHENTDNATKGKPSLAKQQQDLIEQSKRLQEKLSKLKKAGENTSRRQATPSPKEAETVQKYQEKSLDLLKQQEGKGSESWQKKSINKMEQLQHQLTALQDIQEKNLNMEIIKSLRYILHDLVKLSQNQEALMVNFRNVSITDPRYIDLSRQQLNLQSDYKILKDSLLSLSHKDFFIHAAALRETEELDYHLNKALQHIRERQQGNGQTEMQWSMAKINNLALLLDAHLSMMMNAPTVGFGDKKSPKLSEMQKRLNQRIMELKKSGKTAQPLTKELARIATEQERIRRILQKMEKLKKNGGKSPGEGIAGKMKETEQELLKKHLSEQTLKRQQAILTRLLNFEKSMREQDTEEKRKGISAEEYQKNLPNVFEEYIKQKQKEVELLNTMPPKMKPYYKKEVNQYFRRIKSH